MIIFPVYPPCENLTNNISVHGGWILGGIGVLLAVPLTLLVQMVCELSDETRWIGSLLGPPPEK